MTRWQICPPGHIGNERSIEEKSISLFSDIFTWRYFFRKILMTYFYISLFIRNFAIFMREIEFLKYEGKVAYLNSTDKICKWKNHYRKSQKPF